MTILSISGVDGSGKSTQIQLLTESLESHKHTVMYFHAVAFSIANKFTKKQNADAGTAETADSEKSIATASWTKIQLRKVALLIDLLRFEHALYTWKRAGYTHVVSDRYFYDSIINILYLSQGKELRSFGAHILAKLITPPTHAFFLSVAPENIMQRDRTPEQGLPYLEQKHAFFTEHVDAFGLVTIDGAQAPEEISQQISQLIQ